MNPFESFDANNHVEKHDRKGDETAAKEFVEITEEQKPNEVNEKERQEKIDSIRKK